jgi:hypothetical protein
LVAQFYIDAIHVRTLAKQFAENLIGGKNATSQYSAKFTCRPISVEKGVGALAAWATVVNPKLPFDKSSIKTVSGMVSRFSSPHDHFIARFCATRLCHFWCCDCVFWYQ